MGTVPTGRRLVKRVQDVDVFLKHYSRKVRSEKTRENIGYVLKGLCIFAHSNPDELISQSKSQASKLVQEYIDSLASKDYSTRYVNVCLAFLKTFYSVNGFKGSRTLEVERHYQQSRYRKRPMYIPSPTEIWDIATAAGSKRNRATILGVYTSGIRNSTFRAILYGDIKEELNSQKEILKFSVYPEMKKVDGAACKGNIPYYTFISKEAAEALKEYLAEKVQVEGSLEVDKPLFSSDSHSISVEQKSKTPLMKKSLEAMIKTASRKARVAKWKDVYPHCLRKAFESALRNARLDPKDQEFLMGHILPGTQDVYYDKTKVENLRRKYATVDFFPEKNGMTEDARKRQIIDMAKVFGFSEDKIKKMEGVLAKHRNVDESIQELSRLKEDPDTNDREEGEVKAAANHDKAQGYFIVKGDSDMIRRLNDGWKLIQPLNDEKYLFRQ